MTAPCRLVVLWALMWVALLPLRTARAYTYYVQDATVVAFAPQPGRPQIDFLLAAVTTLGLSWSTWDRATGQWSPRSAPYPGGSSPELLLGHFPMVAWFDGEWRANAFYGGTPLLGAPWWTSAGLQLNLDRHAQITDRQGSDFRPGSAVLRQTNRPYLHFFGGALGDPDCRGLGLREYWWNADLSQWAWTYHGCPGGRAVSIGRQSAVSTRQYGPGGYAPGLPVHTFIFVVGHAGLDHTVWARHVSVGGAAVPWGWLSLGAPAGATEVSSEPLALTYDRGGGVWRTHVFVTARSEADGRFHLYEKFVDTGSNSADWNRFAASWVDHGSPHGLDPASGSEGGFTMTTAVVRQPGGSLRIGLYGSSREGPAANGQLVERFWNGSAWAWADPDRSPERDESDRPVPLRVVSSAAGQNGHHVKVFAISDKGTLWERRWDTAGNWSWHRH